MSESDPFQELKQSIDELKEAIDCINAGPEEERLDNVNLACSICLETIEDIKMIKKELQQRFKISDTKVKKWMEEHEE